VAKFWRYLPVLTIFSRNFWKWVMKFDTLKEKIELNIVLI